MAKEITLEQATANYDAAKSKASKKWKEVQAFQKEHKLAPGKKPADKKDAKAYEALKAEHAALKETRDEAEKVMKSLKPASTVSRAKYEYPADIVSNEDKKRYRAQQRAAAKKDGKAEAKAEKAESKKSKKAKEEAPVETKVSKKDKKAKKNKPEVDEDED